MENNWRRVTRAIDQARNQLRQARNEEDFQSIGLLCRETIISLSQIVFDSALHLSENDPVPSPTDAKAMLTAFIQSELGGRKKEVMRRFARSSLDLANELVHKRTATHDDAAQCVEATAAVVGVIGRISGQSIESEVLFPTLRFGYSVIELSSELHTYQLEVVLDNGEGPAISGLKLEIDFPDLDVTELKWRPLSFINQPSYQRIEIGPPSSDITYSRTRRVVSVTYRPSHEILPGEEIDLSEAICLKYRFDDHVYANLEDLPPLRWRMYANIMSPKTGEVYLENLNKY